ncbi:MAG: HAMP domain-containing sensor histidine kinase [Planctomycetota bacterium]
MSVKHKIGLALGIVLLLHVFTAVMGHVGLSKAQRDFARYEAVNADTLSFLNIDRTVLEMQRTVNTFMLTGHDSAADRVREIVDEIVYGLGEAIHDTEQRRVIAELEEMSERMRRYRFDFEKVAVDRARRAQLVRHDMQPKRDQILAILDDSQFGSNQQAQVRLARNEVLLGVNASLQYLDLPGRPAVDAAVVHLRAARDLLDSLPAHAALIEAGRLITEYERAFLSVVQSTQGYLHLVNVVLAGEASELLRQSSLVRSRSLDEREQLRADMQAGAVRFQVFSDIIAVITVLAGLLTAGLMTRAVLKPILRLTKTLRALSNGDADASIADLDRSDEIGAMAHAAEVFRLRNIETELLLRESQQMGADLEQRTNEMTQFVYTVSHDLKSPLLTIEGYTGHLLQDLGEGRHDRLDDFAQRVREGAHRMRANIDDLLELSRVGRETHELVDVDPGYLFRLVASEFELQIKEAHATVTIEEDCPTMHADPIRIRQVFENLLTNALKYGQTDERDLEIGFTCSATDDHVRICVADNGPGIKHEHHERIFGLFQRLRKDATGTGIGLSIVQRVAEVHGGRAWVEETPGGGATFIVELARMPICQSPATSLSIPAA